MGALGYAAQMSHPRHAGGFVWEWRTMPQAHPAGRRALSYGDSREEVHDATSVRRTCRRPGLAPTRAPGRGWRRCPDALRSPARLWKPTRLRSPARSRRPTRALR